MLTLIRVLKATPLAVLVGCAPVAADRGQSVTAHEAAAIAEEQHADAHETEFDADARKLDKPVTCSNAPGIYDTCWSVVINPTRVHLAEADDHRRRASAHRKAAKKLATAEARACVDLADYDRDLSPFFHGPDIAEVVVGHDKVTVRFRSIQGLDRQKMQRIVDCHLARNAALGYDRPEMDYCPLVPAGVAVRVDEDADGVTVDVHARDPSVAEDVVDRGHRLEARARQAEEAREPR